MANSIFCGKAVASAYFEVQRVNVRRWMKAKIHFYELSPHFLQLRIPKRMQLFQSIPIFIENKIIRISIALIVFLQEKPFIKMELLSPLTQT